MGKLGKQVLDLALRYKYALLVVVLGIALMLIPGRTEKTAKIPTVTSPQTSKSQDFQQLEDFLCQIQGVGKVHVLLAYAKGEETVYQTDSDISDNDSRIDTVIITDSQRGESGLVQQINPPTYLGAVVVCQGADRAEVRLAIVEAVSTYTGLGADRISVLKMK